MTKSENLGCWIYLLMQTFLIPSILLIVNTFLNEPFLESELNFLFFALNFICVTVICRGFLLASVKDLIARPFECFRWAFIGFLAYYALSFAVSLFVGYVKPDFINANDNSIATLTQENHKLISIGTILLVPTVEETFYRGLIFRGLYNRSSVAAYIVSAVVFCSVHIVGYIGIYDLLSLCLAFLQYLPAGICLAWAYAKADNIFASILIHTAVNQIAISAMR